MFEHELWVMFKKNSSSLLEGFFLDLDVKESSILYKV